MIAYWHLLSTMLHRTCEVNALEGTVYRLFYEGSCAAAWWVIDQVGGVLVWL